MTVGVRTRRSTEIQASSTLGIALLTLWFGGYAPADAAPVPEQDPNAAELEDGLQQVPTRGPGTFWVRPGVDLRGYDRVALRPLTIEYKKKPRHYQIYSSTKGVLLTDRDQEKLQQWFYEIFRVGLARGRGFGPASTPDPGLLWVSTSLVDVIVRYGRIHRCQDGRDSRALRGAPRHRTFGRFQGPPVSEKRLPLLDGHSGQPRPLVRDRATAHVRSAHRDRAVLSETTTGS